MWDNEILARAREEQLMINTALSKNKKNTPTSNDVIEEKNKITQMIQGIARRRAIHKVAEDIFNVATKLRPFLQKTLDQYLLAHPHEQTWVDTIMDEIRGAIYTLVYDLSNKNIRVSVTQDEHQQHIQRIRDQLAIISTLINDDCIELDVNMDCSQDERIARRMQINWDNS